MEHLLDMYLDHMSHYDEYLSELERDMVLSGEINGMDQEGYYL